MPERTFLVHGRVQGVGFRWWTRSLAGELGIDGTVRNREDGRVEVRARGSDETLAQLRRRLAEGPPSARVDGVEEQDGAALGELRGFHITH